MCNWHSHRKYHRCLKNDECRTWRRSDVKFKIWILVSDNRNLAFWLIQSHWKKKKKKKRQIERKKKKSCLDYEWISTSPFTVFFSGFALLVKIEQQAHYCCLSQFVVKLSKIYSMGLFLVWFFSALLRGVLIYFVWFASVYLEDGLSDK